MRKVTPAQSVADLKPDFNDQNGIWLTNGYTLRTMIGILGMLLPLFLWLYLSIDTAHYAPLESISHYYYTRAGTIFTIIVSLLAIFLIIYKGREPVDFYLSLVAGIFALFVLLYPTCNLCYKDAAEKQSYCITILPETSLTDARVLFHYISAAIFLLCLAGMSLFVFTRSKVPVKQRGAKKIIRNRIYIICGIIMVAAVSVIFFGGFLGALPEETYNQNHITFWMETLAVEAFGFSWLVKGEMLIKSLRDVGTEKD